MRVGRFFQSAGFPLWELDLRAAWKELNDRENKTSLGDAIEEAATRVQVRAASGHVNGAKIPPTVLTEAWGSILAQYLAGRMEIHQRVAIPDSDQTFLFVTRIPDVKEPLSSVVVIAVDVTEEVRLERQMHATQRMEAIGRLVAGVTHDLNNLLMIMGSHIELLTDDLGPGPHEEDLQVVSTTIGRATELVRQLLVFGRRQPRSLEQVDFSALVQSCRAMLRTAVGESIALSFETATALPPIRADRSQFEQVLVNLVVNARDATPPGGRIRVSTSSWEVEAPLRRGTVDIPPGRYVCLGVTDTGSGIDPGIVDHIFEPFFTTKGDLGTGLGLATVYGIVKQNGGLITVESEQGEGTTIQAWFPTADSKESRRGLPSRPLRILLVDDNSVSLRTMSRALERRGHAVTAQDEPEKALNAAAGHDLDFDLVITDLVMPGMNGIDLLRRLRERKETIAAVVTSGYGTERALAEMLVRCGATFLPKPASNEDISRVIAKAIIQAERLAS